MESDTKDPRLESFLERSARFYEEAGWSRIAGRIAGLLLLNDQALALDEIAAAVGASKGSASTNARLLEASSVIQRETRPGDRRDYYRLASRGGTAPLEALLARVQSLRDLYAEGREVPSASPSARNRLRLTVSFLDHAQGSVRRDLAEWLERTEGRAR